MTATNNSTDQPREEDRSYEDQYAGMGTFVDDDALPYGWKKTKAKVDREPEPEEEQPPRQERRSGTNSSPRAPPLTLPAALEPYAKLKCWVYWRMDERGGKPTKLPYQPHLPGRMAKTNDPKTWSDFETAVEAAESEAADGVGLMLLGGELGAFDLDDCRDPKTGEISTWARDLVARAGSYAEITPSGTGLRIIGVVSGEKVHRKLKMPGGGSVECYRACQRYITVTGDQLPGTPDELVDIDAVMDAVVEELGEAKAKASGKTDDAKGRTDLTTTLIAMLKFPDPGKGKECAGLPTRSDYLFAFFREAHRGGIAVKTVVEACLDETFTGCAIREHVRENGDDEAYVKRQIERFREKMAGEFERDANNKIRVRSQHNIRVALGLLDVTLSYDEFSDRMLIKGLDKFDVLNDAAIDRLWLAIDQQFKLLPPNDFFITVVKDFARANKFHPVRDYLDALVWDKKERIDNWLITYSGTKDTAYTRAVGRLMLIAAVRRVRKPGCKFDEMVLLEGPQGSLKSTLLRTLAVREEWFSDDLPLNVDAQKFIERVRGRWIIEASELKGMKTADVEHLKAMLSRTHDRARAAWGRMLTEMPRHCVIAGTTNDAKYFRDLTGNRRFWPIAVTTIDIDAISRDRDQLWAEAAAAEARGESIRLAKELWPEAGREQELRLEDEPWKEMIEEVLGDMQGKILKSDVREIINRPSGQFTAFDAKRLVRAMKELGWQDEKKLRFGGDPQHCWYRGNSNLAKGPQIKNWLRTINIKIRVAAEYLAEGKDYNPRTESDKEPL